ncbi:SRPBCC family protein [Paludibacterium paludis]|uniref:Polyketide cyclase/dehydrase/lipid transport protein n=1 Tax=Paludibacterium paludis TaxID=1225769 RepID=A0A918UC04_9NEIS|nr:SRPBCC family protein [Paludibacterium paludis]GGY26600.1 hypothetical protein GCM10011289_32690 [Paludibacterium paludis]
MWKTAYSIDSRARPETIWQLFRDVEGWQAWNAGIEEIQLHGPFAVGTWFTMTPPGQESLRSVLTEVVEPVVFTDETRVEGLVVVVSHRIDECEGGATRITYEIEVSGDGAEEAGRAISADFPDVLRALSGLAEARSGG